MYFLAETTVKGARAVGKGANAINQSTQTAMQSSPDYFFIAYISFVCLVFLGLVFYLMMKKSNKAGSRNKFKVADKIYGRLTALPFIGKDLIATKNSIYYKSYATENVLRYKAVTTYFTIWVLTLLVYALYYFAFCTDIYLTMVGIIFAFFAKNVIAGVVVGDDTKILHGLLDALLDFRQQFHFEKDVENTLIAVTNNADVYMISQLARLQEGIAYEDTLDIYNQECPNSYLKSLANICYRAKEFGDNQEDGHSVLLEGVQNIAKAVKEELNLRREIRAKSFGLVGISLVPILLTNLCKKMALSNFEDSQFFYVSNLDLMFRFSFMCVTFLCYKGIKMLTNFTESSRHVQLKENRWEERLLKYNFVKRFIKLIEPKRGSKWFLKFNDLLEDSGSNLTMDWIYVRKVICFIVAFFISMSLTLRLNSLAKEAVFSGNSSKFIAEDYKKIKVDKKNVTVGSIDKEILTDNTIVFDDEYKSEIALKTEKIVEILDNKGIDEQDREEFLKRLQAKVDLVNSTKVTILDLIYWLIFSLVAYTLPTVSTYITCSLMSTQMAREVTQFQTLILLLMYDPLVDVNIILEWMESFSVVFKDPIIVCRNSMLRGSEEALLDLKINVKYKDFGKIVNSLLQAEELPIREVFDNLRTEQVFLAQDRAFKNSKIIDKRTRMARFLGFVPTIYLIVGYMIIPLFWGGWIGVSDMIGGI